MVLSRSPLNTAGQVLASAWWVDVFILQSWTPVRGISQFNPDLSVSTDAVVPMTNDGWAFPVKSSMGWSIGFTVQRKPTFDAQPVYDPGQEALRDAVEDPWGVVQVRWYKVDTVGGEAYSGIGIVQYSPSGGGTSDLDTATVTITGQGPRRRIDFPGVPT